MQTRFVLLFSVLILISGSAFAESELVVNGGFEASATNLAPWQINASSTTGANPSNVITSFVSKSGTNSLQLAGNNGFTQDIYQTVTFPTNLISAVLSLDYDIYTTDVSGLAHNTMTISITDETTNVLTSAGSASNLNPTTGFAHYDSGNFVKNSLATYAGKTANIHFKVVTDSVYGYYTQFFLDNVSMLVATTNDIPRNDSFTNATVLTGAAVNVVATNTYATKEAGEPKHAGIVGGHSVWWRWTAPQFGNVAIHSTGSSFPLALAVYTGNTLTNLTPIAGFIGNPAQVSFSASAGTNYAIAVDGFNGASGAILLSLGFTRDAIAPSVAIVSPTAGGNYNSPILTVLGTAADNVAVASVEYRLENYAGTNAYTTAMGTNHWTASISNLVLGVNTVRVRAIDVNGNISSEAVRTFNYIAASPITLSVQGSGSITGATNGQLLNIGFPYKLTAVPSNGFSLSSWTGSSTGTSNVLNFIMQSNLTLRANFVDTSNPIVTITSPTPNQMWSNATFTVVGKTIDNVAVSNVFYSLNYTNWVAVDTNSVLTNWTAAVTLVPGTNVIKSYTLDTAGNYSKVATVSWLYVVTQPLIVNTNGRGTVTPNYNNSQLQVGVNYTMTALPAPTFALKTWTDGNGHVLTNGSTLKFTMSSNLVINANFDDAIPPTIAITNLPVNGLISNQTLVVAGLARDNLAVTNVLYRLNSTNWLVADMTNNWTNWSANLNLTPGTNVFSVYAQDSAGNSSRTNTVRLMYVVNTSLVVITNGKGIINPILNGSLLRIGQNYTLTAIPGIGNILTNWTDGSGNVISNKPALTFMMVSNLSLTANFVDVAKPILTVLNPYLWQRVTNASLVAIGRAIDNVAVTNVSYQLNGGSWQSVNSTNGYTNWNTTLNLMPGTNVLLTYATDTSTNYSITNTLRLVYVTAPVTLNNLEAIVAPLGETPFEIAFGSTTFSQASVDTNALNGVGNYTYTQLSPTSGKLTITYTAPPQATNGGTHQILLNYTAPKVAQFSNPTDSTDFGGILFTSTPVIAPASILYRTLVQVDEDGEGKRTTFGFGRYDSVNLVTLLTNTASLYTYRTYSPLGALGKLVSSNGVNYFVLTFQGTNFGAYYDENYNAVGTNLNSNLGVFGFTSQRLGGNAPTNIVNRSAVVTTTNGGFKLSFLDAVNFVSLNATNDAMTNGLGTYVYNRTGTNLGNLDLIYVSPLETNSVLFQFVATNIATFTNPDSTVGAAVFK